MSSSRSEKARERKRKVFRMRAAIIGAVLVALAFWYCMVAASYKKTFLPHTFINGFDAGGMTEAEAEEVLKDSVEDYSLELAFRGGRIETISNSDIDLTYVPSGEVGDLLSGQNRLSWLSRKLGKSVSCTVSTSFRFDESALRTKLASMEEYAGGEDPEDAKIILQEDRSFKVQSESEGNAVDQDVVFQLISDAVNAESRRLVLYEAEGAYKEPAVRSEDADLVSHCEELNSFSQRTFTVNCRDGQTETVGPAELSSWVTHDTDSDTWTIDEDDVYSSCYAFVQKIADRDDEVHTTMQFVSTAVGSVTVPCYEYGYEIDVGDGASALYTAMSEDSQEPVEMVNSIDAEPLDTTDTYIEVDVTNQVLYYYRDGKVYFRTNVVTGLESDPERRTPSGVFYIQGKDQDRILGTLTAVDPGARYESHVDYWMPFFYSYGMHDASWREETQFGGTMYLEYGSHGCVNLPPASAEKIFNTAEVGTAVVVVREGDNAPEGTEIGDVFWNPPEGGLHYTEYEEDETDEEE